MHIWDNKRCSGHRRGAGGGAGILLLLAASGFLTSGAMLAGCASPGNPLPPTLNLPAVVSGTSLTAVRVGDAVQLHWTTPRETTDKLAIKGPVTAVICREAAGVASAAKTPCAAVARVAVTPGESVAADTLPAELTAGPARLLAYRVELLNAAGRTAGPSSAVFAAAGAAPAPIEGFAGDVTKAGVVLRWKAQGTDSIELERTALDAPKQAAPAEKFNGLPGAAKRTAVTRLRAGSSASAAGDSAGSGDAGGTTDRTAELGHAYSYTAQRVHAETVGGQRLESRSAATAALTFTVRDVFPPEVPGGLVAVPALVGAAVGQAGEPGQKPAIDLSWEPDVEPRVAGYRVYRREALADSAGGWQPISTGLVAGAAYRDATVAAGHKYAYRVTAVNTAGNESGPSSEAVETAPE